MSREPLKQWSTIIHIVCKEVQDFCLGLGEGKNDLGGLRHPKKFGGLKHHSPLSHIYPFLKTLFQCPSFF